MMPAEPIPLHRTGERRHLNTRHRVERLEEDVDGVEGSLRQMAGTLQRVERLALGILLSTLGGTIALIANLAVGRH